MLQRAFALMPTPLSETPSNASPSSELFSFFFFNDTATTEIYTLSLHDALPICSRRTRNRAVGIPATSARKRRPRLPREGRLARSEEHTSELQSLAYLVCRLLLEKKKNQQIHIFISKKKKNIKKTE